MPLGNFRKKQRRSWQHHFKQDYHNPLFDRQTKGGRAKIYLTSLLIIFLVLLYGLLTNQKFELNQISIAGNHKINEQQIKDFYQNYAQQRKLFFSHRGNYFIFSSKDFSKQLVEKLQIVSVTIDKKFPNQININILERTPALLLNNGGQSYHLDNKGLVYEEATQQDLNNLPTLKLDEPTKITLESEPLKKELFTFIMLLQRQLINLNVPVNYFEMNTANSLVLKVQTTEKWYLLFNLQEDLDKQTQKLKVVLQNKISDRSKLEYIDLRFGDKIFYK